MALEVLTVVLQRIQVFWVVMMHNWVSDHHQLEESKCFHLHRSSPLKSTVGLFLALNMKKTHCTFTILSTAHHVTQHHILRDLNPRKNNHVIWWILYWRTVRYCSAHLSQRLLLKRLSHVQTLQQCWWTVMSHKTDKFQFLCLLLMALANMYRARQWIGQFCNTVFFSGSATLGRMPLWPFCCQL